MTNNNFRNINNNNRNNKKIIMCYSKNMILKIISTYDKITKEHENIAQIKAERATKEILERDIKNLIKENKFPFSEDKIIYELGTIDTETGQIKPKIEIITRLEQLNKE